MIPTDHIHFNDDGTAWWVWTEDDHHAYANVDHDNIGLDRPCDTCGGSGTCGASANGQSIGWQRCNDCHGTGRHVFQIEVVNMGTPYQPAKPHYRTLRVHVVPGMVLPIVADVGRPVPSETHIRITGGGIAWLAERIDGGGWRHTEITLPPDAKPGMWAVKLAVSNRAGGGGA